MRKSVQNIVTVTILLEMMGVFAALAQGGATPAIGIGVGLGPGNGVLIFFEISLYGAFVLIALRERRMMVRATVMVWPFILICGAALCSVFWSIEPGATLRRALVIVGTTLIGIYCGTTYSIVQFQRLLVKALLIMIAASCAFFFVDPSLVTDPVYGGSFQGLTGAKNYFAEYMVMLMVLAITSECVAKSRAARALLFLIGGILLFRAHSDTAVLSLIPVVLLLIPALLLLRGAPRLAISVFFILLAVGAVFGNLSMPQKDSLVAVVGRDPNLTGRDKVWAVARQAIEKKPMLGYGFDAFWESNRGGLLYEKDLGWAAPHSHDGYLETLLGLGVWGLILLAIALVRTVRDSLSYYWHGRRVHTLWPIAFLITLLLHAITESDLLARHGMSYFVLIVLSTQLARYRKGKSGETHGEEGPQFVGATSDAEFVHA